MYARPLATQLSRLAPKCLVDQSETGVMLVSVRWRKRRWEPKAPSKMFVVRESTPRDPEEYAETTQRYKNYQVHFKAVRKHTSEELLAIKKQEEKTSSQFFTPPEEWAAAKGLNDLWNQETARIREARQTQEEKEQEERMLQSLMEKEAEANVARRLAQLKVQEELEASKHFITLETLDEAIEGALDSTSDYNFAIDKDGNRYYQVKGEATTSKDQQETQQSASSV